MNHLKKSEIEIDKIDFLLIRTDWDKKRNKDDYISHFPTLSQDFYDLDNYIIDIAVSVDSFEFSLSQTTQETGNNYSEFEEVKIMSSKIRVTITNNTGLTLGDTDSSVEVTLHDMDGSPLDIDDGQFDFGILSDGDEETAIYYYGNASFTKDFYKTLMVKVKGVNSTTGSFDLNKNNALSISVGFDTIVYYQINASEYTGPATEDEETSTNSTEISIKVDKNDNDTSDIDIYKGEFSNSDSNFIELDILLNAQSAAELTLSFADIFTGYSIGDSLTKIYYISPPAEDQTQTTEQKTIPLAGYSFGQSYSGDSSEVFDTLKVKASVKFVSSQAEITSSIEDYIEVNFAVNKLEFDKLEVTVKEDLNLDAVDGSMSVGLDIIEFRDEDGKNLDSIMFLGSSQMIFSLNKIITLLSSDESFTADNNMIEIATFFEAENPKYSEIKRSFSDTFLLDVDDNYSGTILDTLNKSDEFLYLLGILPETIDYTITSTINKKDFPVEILSSDDIDISTNILSDIIIDTESDTISVIVLNKDSDGNFSQNISVVEYPIETEQLDNFISGNLIVTYSNSTNVDAEIQLIVSTDESVVYDANIQTDANIYNVGLLGYPSYIARILTIDELESGSINQIKTVPIDTDFLEPFTFENTYIGVIVPFISDNADFSGELEIKGKLEFEARVDEDIYD